MSNVKFLACGALAVALAGCANAVPTVLAPGTMPAVPAKRNPAVPYPPVCTTPPVKSGQALTTVSAFGSIRNRRFVLAQPSSWTQVVWYKIPPPRARRDAVTQSPHTRAKRDLFIGTYRISDGTIGCLEIAQDHGAQAALTAIPHIPDTGATLPGGFGSVKTIVLSFDTNGAGTGTISLVHPDGSGALHGTLKISGRITEMRP